MTHRALYAVEEVETKNPHIKHKTKAQIVVTIDKDIHEKLMELKKKRGSSISQIVNRALIEYLLKLEKESNK